MLTLLFVIMMVGVFGRLAGFAFRMSWGFLRVLLTLIFLPVIIIACFAGGLLFLAFPVLAVVGLISLLTPRRRIDNGYYGDRYHRCEYYRDGYYR